jgi:Holliday junction resolvasome RuvABC ATP-dependent DNA helicase subunit
MIHRLEFYNHERDQQIIERAAEILNVGSMKKPPVSWPSAPA